MSIAISCRDTYIGKTHCNDFSGYDISHSYRDIRGILRVAYYSFALWPYCCEVKGI